MMLRKLYKKLVMLIAFSAVSLLLYKILIFVNNFPIERRIYHRLLHVHESTPESLPPRSNSIKEAPDQLIILERHYDHPYSIISQSRKLIDRSSKIDGKSRVDSHKLSFVNETLEKILASDDYGLSQLPVSIDLNCSERRKKQIRADVVCVDELDVIKDMNFHNIEINRVTLLELNQVLVRIIIKKLQDNILKYYNSGRQNVSILTNISKENTENQDSFPRNSDSISEVSIGRSNGVVMKHGRNENKIEVDFNERNGNEFHGNNRAGNPIILHPVKTQRVKKTGDDGNNQIQNPAIIAHRNSRENPDIPPDKYPVNPNSKVRSSAERKRLRRSLSILSPSLLKLLGRKIPRNSDLLMQLNLLNFSFSSDRLKDHRQYVDKFIEGFGGIVQGGKVRSSLNPDLIQRGNFQRQETNRFCQETHTSRLLTGNAAELDTLLKHLLYDDKKKIVFCYVPKNGCSNMKRMMLTLNGVLPPLNTRKSMYNRPDESVLNSVHSFRNLTSEEAIYRLQNYYKFAVIRNPLERLVSGYINKLQRPFNITHKKKFPDQTQAYILNIFDTKRFRDWISSGNYSQDIHPSFTDFLKFMTKYSLSAYNEHFMPFMQLCYPCAIHYDLLLNLKTINYDVYALMEYLGIPSNYYPPVVAHQKKPTTDLLKDYFKHVPASVKNNLYETLSQELNFYYHMQPEEEGMLL